MGDKYMTDLKEKKKRTEIIIFGFSVTSRQSFYLLIVFIISSLLFFILFSNALSVLFFITANNNLFDGLQYFQFLSLSISSFIVNFAFSCVCMYFIRRIIIQKFLTIKHIKKVTLVGFVVLPTVIILGLIFDLILERDLLKGLIFSISFGLVFSIGWMVMGPYIWRKKSERKELERKNQNFLEES